jgi:protein-disulfide isomerase
VLRNIIKSARREAGILEPVAKPTLSPRKRFVFCARAGVLQPVLACLVAGLVWLSGQAKQQTSAANGEAATRNKVARYIREKFFIADSVKLTVGPLHASANPNYYECVVTADDGKQPRSQNFSVSKDGRYLGMSSMFVLGPDTKNEIIRTARQVFRLAPTLQLTLSDLRNSVVPNFSVTTVTFDDGKQKQAQEFFVTKDNRYLVLGDVFKMMSASEVLRLITTRNEPGAGPANAPVTIVEYADLECPTCARLHEFLENNLLPKYGDKVRIVFKEFPLAAHDWSQTAAIANQCAYQIEPSAFLKYRDLIFQNQPAINLANLRDLLLAYGEQAGVDRLKLAACIDSKASLPRVEANRHEGEKLQVGRTPTLFINGKMLVGFPPADSFYQIVDGALRAAEKSPRP